MDGRRKNYRAWDPQQNRRDAISPHEALPEDDLVFFLIDLIPQRKGSTGTSRGDLATPDVG